MDKTGVLTKATISTFKAGIRASPTPSTGYLLLIENENAIGQMVLGAWEDIRLLVVLGRTRVTMQVNAVHGKQVEAFVLALLGFEIVAALHPSRRF